MRVLCEASVIDRNQPQHKGRRLKSAISIGYHSRNEEKAEMFLLHENVANKTGRRYKVKQNINKMFLKFLNEGKATISFKEPPHDLQINCDKIQLVSFMKAFRMGVCGDSDFSNVHISQPNLNARKLPRLKETPFSLKNHVNRKMVLKNRSDLDKGIARTVEDLTVSG